MKTHVVKIWPEYFHEVQTGEWPLDLRIDDRGYTKGDSLMLREWDPVTMEYTGKMTCKKIVHVLKIIDLRAEIRTMLGVNPSPAKMGNLVILSLKDNDL